MNAPTKIRPEFLYMFDPKEVEFDPTNPDAPAEGDGLPLIEHNVYDCIELCCDDHQAGLPAIQDDFLLSSRHSDTVGDPLIGTKMPKKGPPLSFMQMGYVGRPGRRNPGTRRWSATPSTRRATSTSSAGART